jgi:hypothetical protein
MDINPTIGASGQTKVLEANKEILLKETHPGDAVITVESSTGSSLNNQTENIELRHKLSSFNKTILLTRDNCQSAELKNEFLCQYVLVSKEAGPETTYSYYNPQGVVSAELTYNERRQDIPVKQVTHLFLKEHPTLPVMSRTEINKDFYLGADQIITINNTYDVDGFLTKKISRFEDMKNTANTYQETFTYDHSIARQTTVKGIKIQTQATHPRVQSKKVSVYQDMLKTRPLEVTYYTYRESTSNGWPGYYDVQCHSTQHEYTASKLIKTETEIRSSDHLPQLSECLDKAVTSLAVNDYTYDWAGRMTKDKYVHGTKSSINTFSYDGSGNLKTSLLEASFVYPSVKTDYTYKRLWQALGVEEPQKP